MTAAAPVTESARPASDDLLVATGCTKRFGGLVAVSDVAFAPAVRMWPHVSNRWSVPSCTPSAVSWNSSRE